MTITILSFDIGITNLAFCEITVPSLEPGHGPSHVVKSTIKTWEIIEVRTKGEKIPFDETMKRLLVHLEKRWPKDSKLPDHILLENQPCMKNPTMKSIQVYIYAYFHTIGCLPRLASAINKLKVKRNLEPPKKTSYGEKKKLAVLVTRLYIYDDWLAFFDKQKKKDDYSDSFLQAIHFIENV